MFHADCPYRSQDPFFSCFPLKHAIRNHLSRVIYVIPFTSIIEQNAAVFRKAVGDEAVLEHHSNVAPANDSEDRCPTPAELAEQNWDMPIVVTTNVQFFESLFSNRPSRSRKLHNIAKSVIVLDEAQMLPVELLRPCVAAIAELVSNYGATVVLCSATQPALQGLLPEDLEPREIVRNPGALYRSLKRVEVRRLGVLEDASIAQEILDREQALCIVNTRAHARQLFQLVGQADGHYHLSAAMCPKHRTTCLDEIRYRLKSGMRCRVVSTQLIEAGVDVDFPVVMRAVAGIDPSLRPLGDATERASPASPGLHSAGGAAVSCLVSANCVNRCKLLEADDSALTQSGAISEPNYEAELIAPA